MESLASEWNVANPCTDYPNVFENRLENRAQWFGMRPVSWSQKHGTLHLQCFTGNRLFMGDRVKNVPGVHQVK